MILAIAVRGRSIRSAMEFEIKKDPHREWLGRVENILEFLADKTRVIVCIKRKIILLL